ncbi:MAG TPA: hypothetical protein VFB12_13310, partial [Ktedonobacteraceae bacterium]|nr:hypothetical protein [Ktedonobacteraceae bacterium]
LLFMGGLTSYRIFSKLFSTPQPIELDVRTLRQLGITPYTVSPTRNRTDKQLVQRRRRNRRMRLAHIEELNVETWSEHEVPLWSPTDATSTSGYRKSAPLESPAALNGSSASTHGLPAAANWSPNNVNTSIYNSSVPAASTDAASTSGYRKSIPLRSLANANGSPAASGSTPLVQPVLHSLANESQRIIDRLADTSTQNWWDYETVEMGITLPGRGLPSKIRWSSE